MPSSSSESLNKSGELLGIHRGAIDQSTITTKPPSIVMKRVNEVLQNMGVEIQVESEFKYRCIRGKKEEGSSQPVIYGEPTEDPADEVRFSVELTRLAGLIDTYSLDIRRLKGNLRSYKFLYDTIRQRADLSQ